MRKYFYTNGKEIFGPFLRDELRNLDLTRSSKFWYYGLESWVEISMIEELEDISRSLPPDLKISINELKLEKKNNTTNLEKILTSINKRISVIFNKWLLAVLIFFSFGVYSILNNTFASKNNLYDQIVANSYSADEDFDIYVEKYYRDVEYFGLFPKRPKTTIIKLSRLDQLDNTTHLHGISFGINNDEKIEIYINFSSWKDLSKARKYYLMYHELSHDVLNLTDLEKKEENKGKLMYPELDDSKIRSMDDFIEQYQETFYDLASKKQ